MSEFEINLGKGAYLPYPRPQEAYRVKVGTGPGRLTIQTAEKPPTVPVRPGWLRLTGWHAAALRPGTVVNLNGLLSAVLWVTRSATPDGLSVASARLDTVAIYRARLTVQAALKQGRAHKVKRARVTRGQV